MKNVLFLNRFDLSFLKIALEMRAKNEEVSAMLNQDAVYIVVKKPITNPDIEKAIKSGVKFYMLLKEVQKRGITKNLTAGEELFDYDQLVDFLAQDNQKVINV